MNHSDELTDNIGDAHILSAKDTPMLPTAFDINDKEKIEKIETKFSEIMEILGLDLTDDSLKETPRRVAKMFVNEIFAGLNPKNKPTITLFKNKFEYNDMLIERDIKVHSHCEHHFVPIIGKAHLAYIPNGKVIGLSKLNRIVKYYSKRPQVQERLTMQIADELSQVLGTKDVAVIIEAEHFCVKTRGIEDTDALTISTRFMGRFERDSYQRKLLRLIGK